MTPARPLRLLVVQETDWLDRGPHQQHHLFERLAARKHTVHVLDYQIRETFWPRGPLLRPTETHPNVSRAGVGGSVTVVRPGTLGLPALSRLLSVPSFYLTLQQQIRAFQPDIIIDYALSTGLPALLTARQHNIPFLLHMIDNLPTLAPRPVQAIARAVERWLLPRADHTLYINHVLREYALQRGADPATAHYIPSGVDLTRFSPDLPTADPRVGDLRAHWGLAPDDVVLLFIGWLYTFAGLETIVRLLPHLPPHVKLLIVGEGDAEPSLRALHAELDLGPRVIFTGRVPYADAPRYMAVADICLLTSDINDVMRYIVPIKTFEYMAAGRPVLATHLPGLKGDIPPGNGILYADPTEFLPILTHLATHPAERTALGQSARAFAEENHDWDKLTDAFEQLLHSLASPR